MRRAACFFILLIGCGFGLNLSAQAKVFAPETFQLANGLELIVVQNFRAPIVSAMLWVGAGAADDPPGQSGLAHYLEHLMFLGTPAFPAGEYSRQLARVGATENAFTGADYTAYFATLAAEHLPLFLKLEADRMQNLSIPEAAALNERAVIREERRQTVENAPERQLVEAVMAALFINHPYARPIIGWDAEMAQFTPAKARAFFKRHYRPANMTLVLSGAITPQKALALTEHYFGALPKQKQRQRQRPARQELRGDVQVSVRAARVQQAQILRAVAVPPARALEDRGAALEVLAEILGNPDVGRLYAALARQQNRAAGVSAHYDGDRLDDGMFSLSITPRAGVAPDTVVHAADAVIQELLVKGVDAAELAAAKTRLARAAVFARDSLMLPGYVFGMARSTGQSIADVESWPQRIRRVTADDVMRAARRVFTQPSVTGLLLPEADETQP